MEEFIVWINDLKPRLEFLDAYLFSPLLLLIDSFLGLLSLLSGLLSLLKVLGKVLLRLLGQQMSHVQLHEGNV